jgi:hypothetical protein
MASTANSRRWERKMNNSDDAKLYAAATIVAAQIAAKTFSVDMGAEENIAGAIADALNAVAAGVKKFEADAAADRLAARKASPSFDIAKLSEGLKKK